MKEKDRINQGKQELSFKDIVNINAWQKIQDNFSAITDVAMRTVDSKGHLLTLPSRLPRLCGELLKNSPLKERFCGSCLPTFLGGAAVVDRHLSYFCHSGICNFVVPLRGELGDALSYLMIGPVILVMRKDKEEYRETAEECNLELEDFWSAILEIKVISFQGIQAIVDLIRDVGEYTIKLAYQGAIKEKEMMMTADSPRLNKLLHALLDVAFQITGADVGSIMALDKENSELIIRASRGIPEEIVRNTRVSLGDGISGIAVKERRPFLIGEHTKDSRIKAYLNRPYLSSSMVLPINLDDTVMGVMNLGVLKTSMVRFNTHSMRVINSLIHLATLALTPSK